MSVQLSDERVQQILDLRGLGWTYRKISETLGMSRETVGYYVRRGKPRPVYIKSKDKMLPTVPVYTCTGCERRVVYDPCKICEARAAKRRSNFNETS